MVKQFLLTLTILFPLSAKSAFKLRHLEIGNEKKVEIYNVVEDHRGIIFASSNTGILEFDGINWRTIETPNKEASLALGLSKEGKVYVSGLSFIGYLSPNFDGDMELQKISIAPEKLRTLGDVIAIETYNDSVVFIYNNGIDKIKCIFDWNNKFSKLFFIRNFWQIFEQN